MTVSDFTSLVSEIISDYLAKKVGSWTSTHVEVRMIPLRRDRRGLTVGPGELLAQQKVTRIYGTEPPRLGILHVRVLAESRGHYAVAEIWEHSPPGGWAHVTSHRIGAMAERILGQLRTSMFVRCMPPRARAFFALVAAAGAEQHLANVQRGLQLARLSPKTLLDTYMDKIIGCMMVTVSSSFGRHCVA